MTTFSDDFNRANSTGLGAAWTGYTNTFDVATNAAKAATSTSAAFYGTQAASDDNFSQATITVLSGIPAVICRLASVGTSDTDTPACYSLRVVSGTQIGLYKKTANSTTQTLIGSLATVTVATNDILKVSAVGTTITGYVNGTQQVQATDSSVTTGKFVGFRASNATTRFDDFSGGDVAAAAASSADRPLRAYLPLLVR